MPKDGVTCTEHLRRTESLEVAMFGKDGNPGVQRKVDKFGLLMSIIIILLLGNGGLLIWTLRTVTGMAK